METQALSPAEIIASLDEEAIEAQIEKVTSELNALKQLLTVAKAKSGNGSGQAGRRRRSPGPKKPHPDIDAALRHGPISYITLMEVTGMEAGALRYALGHGPYEKNGNNLWDHSPKSNTT